MKTVQPFMRDRWFIISFTLVLALQPMLCPGQVTFQQISNALVAYYPLNTVISGNVTPDFISRRDMAMVNMSSNNLVAGSHPGIDPAGLVMNFTQSGGPTVIYYQSIGQDPLDGSGDYFPFINQRGATMNFWIKGPVPVSTDLRVDVTGLIADTYSTRPILCLIITGTCSPWK